MKKLILVFSFMVLGTLMVKAQASGPGSKRTKENDSEAADESMRDPEAEKKVKEYKKQIAKRTKENDKITRKRVAKRQKKQTKSSSKKTKRNKKNYGVKPK